MPAAPVTGKLLLERSDGQRSWVRPDIFSDANQQYIREWILADRVLSEDKLRVKLKKLKIDSYKTGMKADDKAPPGKINEQK